MTSLLIQQTALSFIVGAGFIIASLHVAERFGSALGGVIGGLPSTAAIALLFIALSSGTEAAVTAAGVVPMLMGFCGLFLLCYAHLSRSISAERALICSTLFWLLLSSLAFLLAPLSFRVSLALFLGLLVICGVAVLRWLKLPVFRGRRRSPPLNLIARRGLLAGTIIGSAVLATKLGGPVFGAVFAGFPAVYLSTMWVSARAHGVEFSHSLITPLLFSGLVNVSCYACAVRYFYPRLGIGGGTLAAYTVSFVSAALVLRFINRVTEGDRRC